jgi:hypothetical protein
MTSQTITMLSLLVRGMFLLVGWRRGQESVKWGFGLGHHLGHFSKRCPREVKLFGKTPTKHTLTRHSFDFTMLLPAHWPQCFLRLHLLHPLPTLWGFLSSKSNKTESRWGMDLEATKLVYTLIHQPRGSTWPSWSWCTKACNWNHQHSR